jgi:hypothetical protein
MSKEEESNFKRYRPVITEVTVVKAAEAFGLGDEIVSLSVRSAGIDALILLLATDAEARGPYLLNSVCARELCRLLISEGFGLKK